MSYQLERRVERLEKDVARVIEDDPEAALIAEARREARALLAEYVERVGDEEKALAMFAEDAPYLYAILMDLPPPPPSTPDEDRETARKLYAGLVAATGGNHAKSQELFRREAPTLFTLLLPGDLKEPRPADLAAPVIEPGTARPLTSDETRELVWKLWHGGR
jgi:hypothetical protein